MSTLKFKKKPLLANQKLFKLFTFLDTFFKIKLFQYITHTNTLVYILLYMIQNKGVNIRVIQLLSFTP